MLVKIKFNIQLLHYLLFDITLIPYKVKLKVCLMTMGILGIKITLIYTKSWSCPTCILCLVCRGLILLEKVYTL